MSRTQLLIAIIAGAVILLTIVGIAIKLNQSNDTAQESGRQDQAAARAQASREDDHDDGYERPVVVDDQELSAAQIETDIMPRARDAAMAYVAQSTSETIGERTNRLSPYFVAGSRPLTAAKPSVDSSHAPNSRTTATVVDSSWLEAGSELLATVFLEVVTTTTDSSPREVSRVYQGYDLTMVPTGEGWRAQEITFSTKPLVMRRS